MAHRLITDPNGTTWLVLAVYPHSEDRRSGRDRRTHTDSVATDRRGRERRQCVRREMMNGWLLFKADHGRRRFTPIVPDWEKMPAHELIELLNKAVPARRTTDPPGSMATPGQLRGGG